jgi:hypothetical protein
MNHGKGLEQFLDDGRVEADTNPQKTAWWKDSPARLPRMD